MNQDQKSDELRYSKAITQLMMLPTESQKFLQEKASENHLLHLICESQNIILSNYSDSYKEKLEAETKITEIDKEINKIDILLENANAILSKSLKKENNTENEVGKFLKQMLEKIEQLILDVCISSLNDKSTSVSFMSVIDIEQQIKKLIENLVSNGMYPETESELYKRIADADAHNETLLSFLNGFVDEANRSK